MKLLLKGYRWEVRLQGIYVNRWFCCDKHVEALNCVVLSSTCCKWTIMCYSCDTVEQILNAKTVTAASPMAPACGLYLGSVKYDLPWCMNLKNVLKVGMQNGIIRIQ